MYNQYLAGLVESLPIVLAVWFALIFVSCKKGKPSAGAMGVWAFVYQYVAIDIKIPFGTDQYLQEFIRIEINLLAVTSVAVLIIAMLLKYNRNVYKHCILLVCMIFTHCMLIYTLTSGATTLGIFIASHYHEIVVLLLSLHLLAARNGCSNIIRSLNAIRLHIQYSNDNSFRGLKALLSHQTGYKTRK